MPNAYASSSLDGFNKASLATTASFRLHVSQVSFAWQPDCSASSTICSIARRALGGRLLQAATTSARSCGIDMALSLCTELQSWCNPPARVPVCESAERTVAQCTCKAGAMSDAEGRLVRFPPSPPFLKSATPWYQRELRSLGVYLMRLQALDREPPAQSRLRLAADAGRLRSGQRRADDSGDRTAGRAGPPPCTSSG